MSYNKNGVGQHVKRLSHMSQNVSQCYNNWISPQPIATGLVATSTELPEPSFMNDDVASQGFSLEGSFEFSWSNTFIHIHSQTKNLCPSNRTDEDRAQRYSWCCLTETLVMPTILPVNIMVQYITSCLGLG